MNIRALPVAGNAPNEAVLSLLSDLRARAERGEIVSLLAVYELADGTTESTWRQEPHHLGTRATVALLGELQVAGYALAKLEVSGRDWVLP